MIRMIFSVVGAAQKKLVTFHTKPVDSPFDITGKFGGDGIHGAGFRPIVKAPSSASYGHEEGPPSGAEIRMVWAAVCEEP